MAENMKKMEDNALATDDEAFMKTNSLKDLKTLVHELSDLGEDTTEISELIEELEELYNRFSDLPMTAESISA